MENKDIVFSADCKWIFNLKKKELRLAQISLERQFIKKRIEFYTVPGEDKICFNEKWLQIHSKLIPIPFGIRWVIIGKENRTKAIDTHRIAVGKAHSIYISVTVT